MPRAGLLLQAGFGLRRCHLPLPDQRLDPGNIPPDGADLDRALQLAGGQLEAKVRQVVLFIRQPFLQLIQIELLDFFHSHAQAPS